MKFKILAFARTSALLLLLHFSSATAAGISFCDKLASGDAARSFQNPKDESIGQAWPLQGEVLTEFISFKIAEKEYLAFRKLGKGAEGTAYLGFDSSLNVVVIKDTDLIEVNKMNELMEKSIQTSEQYIREIQIKTKFLKDNGIESLPVLDFSTSANRVILVKPYIPGQLVSNLDSNSSIGLWAENKVTKAMDRIFDLMSSDRYFEIIDRYSISGGFDPSAGNWIYFNRQIYLIDF